MANKKKVPAATRNTGKNKEVEPDDDDEETDEETDEEGEDEEEEEETEEEDEEDETETDDEETDGTNNDEEAAIKLFEKYDEVRAEIESHEKALEELKGVSSDVVKQIFEDYGAGPFDWGGKVMKVSKRNTTYFFKTPSTRAKKIGK